MRLRTSFSVFTVLLFVGAVATSLSATGHSGEEGKDGNDTIRRDGQHLFERETFGGNGRTCLSCHSRKTGTVSPQDALARFNASPQDPLFLHDGSDDGNGNGVTRILAHATILMSIQMAPNVGLAGSDDRSVVVRRGIPTTINTPALDPVLMLDGRQPSLELQAGGAIADHAQGTIQPSLSDLELIRHFQLTDDAFFSSLALRLRALGGPAPRLPRGNTASERRGRRFFEDVPPNPADGFTSGLCAHCHSGTLLNQANEFATLFIGVPLRPGSRFANVGVSGINQMGNPVREFVFNAGTVAEVRVSSPDPGRALITGQLDQLEHFEAFKIAPLRGVRHTAPYFHDNSAKTLEDVARHYALFFSIVTGGNINLTPQDQADMVAFMKLLE